MECHWLGAGMVLVLMYHCQLTGAFSLGPNLFQPQAALRSSISRPIYSALSGTQAWSSEDTSSQSDEQDYEQHNGPMLHMMSGHLQSAWWLIPEQTKKSNPHSKPREAANIQQNDYVGSSVYTNLIGDNNICRAVCSFCRTAFMARISALCYKQCRTGGRAFAACLTWMGIYNFHYEP